jgi:SAM-dependent methyltransferase
MSMVSVLVGNASSVQCPVCGGGPLDRMFELHGFEFVACRACDLALYRGAEHIERSDDLFPTAYFTEGGAGYTDYLADAATHRRQARVYLRRLADLGIRAGPGRRAVDVGCAAGFFMAEARAAGWDVTGCDVSEFVVRHARVTLDLDVVCAGFLDAPFEPHSFDLVTMFGVLEHLPQPRRVVERVYELLRQGGAIAIETWNRQALVARGLGARWHVYAPPSCLWYHSDRSLRRLFPTDRWRALRYGAAPKCISVRHALSALSYMSPRLAAAARRVFDRPAFRDKSVPYAMGDLVFAVFQRS